MNKGILKKKKEDESIFKIILFLPLIFFGFIKNIIDHFSGENSVQRKSITLKKEEINNEIKNMLDEMHKQKIDMSDEIYVINVGEYIGESTKSEIEYAKTKNKKISYLENN